MTIEVISGLWLSDYKITRNNNFLVNKNIKLLINVSNDIPFYKNLKEIDLKYYRFNINENLNYKKINKILNIINKNIIENKSVLIYCNSGTQYSPTLITFYLIKYANIDISNIENIIKSKKSDVFLPENNLKHLCDKYIYYNNKNI